MFTGIITDIGKVRSIEKNADWRIVIETAYDVSSVDLGASIACSGCCLTVVDKGAGWFAFDVSAESLSKTVIGGWDEGVAVNLERALKVGDELGGHIVSGHVDGLAELIDIKDVGGSQCLKLKVPDALAMFIAPKGSVTLDGISLTVNGVEDNMFDVNIIAHTWTHTTLKNRRIGDKLNIEIDMLARYVARMLDKERAFPKGDLV